MHPHNLINTAGLIRYQWVLFVACLILLCGLSAAYAHACQRDFWGGRGRSGEACAAASV